MRHDIHRGQALRASIGEILDEARARKSMPAGARLPLRQREREAREELRQAHTAAAGRAAEAASEPEVAAVLEKYRDGISGGMFRDIKIADYDGIALLEMLALYTGRFTNRRALTAYIIGFMEDEMGTAYRRGSPDEYIDLLGALKRLPKTLAKLVAFDQKQISRLESGA